jgi:hypothetical protein
LPSIIPSYIYTIFATVIISTLIISVCGIVASGVKREVEERQLANIAQYVCVKSMEALSAAPSDNLTTTLYLDLPPLIGSQRYWVQIANDSSSAWVQVGMGETVLSNDKGTLIPANVFATGTYVSDSSIAFLLCYSEDSNIHLVLSGDN